MYPLLRNRGTFPPLAQLHQLVDSDGSASNDTLNCLQSNQQASEGKRAGVALEGELGPVLCSVGGLSRVGLARLASF